MTSRPRASEVSAVPPRRGLSSTTPTSVGYGWDRFPRRSDTTTRWRREGAFLSAGPAPTSATPSIARARSGATTRPPSTRSRSRGTGCRREPCSGQRSSGSSTRRTSSGRWPSSTRILTIMAIDLERRAVEVGLADQPRAGRAEELAVRPDVRRRAARGRVPQAGDRRRHRPRARLPGARRAAEGRASTRAPTRPRRWPRTSCSAARCRCCCVTSGAVSANDADQTISRFGVQDVSRIDRVRDRAHPLPAGRCAPTRRRPSPIT